MHRVSDHVIDGTRGPTAAPVYPTIGEIDLTDIVRFTRGQPWSDYARMRDEAPVMWHPEPRGNPGFWALTRYEDVRQVNADTTLFSSERGSILMSLPPPHLRANDRLFGASMNAMINLDGLPHRQLRKEHMPYFTAGYMRGLRERVAAEVARRLEAMAGRQRADFVAMFAGHLPVFTLCEMLGVPESDRDRFIEWVHFLEVAQQVGIEQATRDATEISPEMAGFIALFNKTVEEMFDYGQDMLRRRRADPREDLMSAIAHARIDGELLDDAYLDGAWLLIVFAGNDTTRNSLSGAMRLFTEHPEQKEALMRDPALLPNAVHEITRLVSPVIYMRRTATEDTRVNGQPIAAGEKVVMYYGAANRDAEIFPDPDRFDIRRANAERNIAFGHGPHICIGRLVAQLQLEESYRQIFARFPDMRWTGQIDIAPNNFVHAIRELEVSFMPRGASA